MNHTPFKGLRTSTHRVSDLQAAIKFYTEVFGIEPYFNEPFYVGWNVAGYEFGLQGYEETEEAIHGNTSYTYWAVDDVQAMYDRLMAMGCTAYETPTDVGGDIVVATVRDPWGNLFGLIYNPHFKLV